MDKDKFEAMLKLAEFGANRMERRQSTEFQIFISYTTLIVLGLYVIITKHDDVDDVFINASATLLCISLAFINFIYIIWQVGLGRAMENDATRRNYYVIKAQDLTGRSPTLERRDKNKEVEYTIFVNTKYRHQFCDLHLIWTDWSRLLLVGIPTILHIILLFEVCKLTNCSKWVFIILGLIPAGLSKWVFIILGLIPAGLIVAGLIIAICKYNHKRK